MKIITVGDIHGETSWKDLIEENPKIDKWVILGDYVDSFHHTDSQIIQNLQNIIQFKKDNMDKVILLLGNHDIMYLYPGGDFSCSGYRQSYSVVVHHLFKADENLFQYCHQIGNYIWTHAGISKTWHERYLIEYDTLTIEQRINMLSDTRTGMYKLAEVGSIRGGMRHNVAGPLWADKSETMNNQLPGFHQIVGHSRVDKVFTIESAKTNSSFTYCDCLQKVSEVYTLEI